MQFLILFCCFYRWFWRRDQCMKASLNVDHCSEFGESWVLISSATIIQIQMVKFLILNVMKLPKKPGFQLHFVCEVKECLPWMCPTKGSNPPCIYKQCLEQGFLEDVHKPLQLFHFVAIWKCVHQSHLLKIIWLKILEKHSDVHM